MNQLTADHAKATKELDRAKPAEAKADKAARFAGISDVFVTENPLTARENVVRSSFTVHWSKPTWNGRENPITKHDRGLTACPRTYSNIS